MIMRIPQNSDLVRWAHLEPSFYDLFPRTIAALFNTGETALVHYCGIPFYIRPRFNPAGDFIEVWGAPAVNHFPHPKGSK